MTKLEQSARQVVANGVQGTYAKYYSVPPADFEALREALDHSADAGNKVSDHIAGGGKVILPVKAVQQIEEALDKLNSVYGLHETPCVAKALATIRAARAQEQAEQEPVAWMIESSVDGIGFRGNEPPPSVKAACKCTPLYAAPVRTKDLTEQEQLELARSSVGKSRHWLVAAVIAAYKEKNK